MLPALEPGINELQDNCSPLGGELVILSSEDSMPATRKVVEFPTPGSVGPPLAPRKRRSRKKAAPPFLQFDELERLFKAITNSGQPTSIRDRAIFRIAYHAGLRASEVGALDMRDYNARTDRIFVNRLKGSNSGDHHLSREESRALKAWLKIRGSQPGVIFASKKRSPISRKRLDQLMKLYGAAANLSPKLRHFHVLKHTCATHLLSKGFHVEQVQDWIGHVNIQNTMIYAHITNARRDEMAAALKEWK